MLIAVRNADGYPMGLAADPDNPTLNTVYGAHRVGLRTFTHPQRETSTAFNREDGKVKQRMKLGVSDDGEGSIEVGSEDETLIAYLREGGYDNTMSDEMMFIAGNRGDVSSKTYYLLAGTLFQKNDSSMYYKYWSYLNNQLEEGDLPEVNQDDGENPSPIAFTFTPSLGGRLITGQPFSTTDMTVRDDEDIFVTIRTPYELHVATWVANGSATDFTLPYLPLKTDATVGGANIICKNGVPTTVTSVSILTGEVVIASAGSSGDIWTVLYPTAWRTA
jgi:hypothetical protein